MKNARGKNILIMCQNKFLNLWELSGKFINTLIGLVCLRYIIVLYIHTHLIAILPGHVLSPHTYINST